MKRKKLSKEKRKEIGRYVTVLSIVVIFGLSLLVVVFGLTTYWIGLHNMDLGHNLRIINAEHNLNYNDINNKFEVWSPTTMYITGMNQMNKALYLCILGSLMFGLSFNFFYIKINGGR